MPNQSKRKRKPAPQHTKAAAKKRAAPARAAREETEQIPKQSFLKRLIFSEEKPDLSELEAGSTTILDILSPTAVDTKSRDYIVVDGVFHAYLYIAGYGYATTVGSCWLAPLVEAGELSCAEASVSAPQSIAANITAATAVVDMIYNILTQGESRVRQVTFSTTSCNVRPTLARQRQKKAA